MDSHDTSTYKAYYNKKMLEDKVECLENLNQKIEEQELKKQHFKQNKYENNSERTFQEPETDS